MSKDGPFARLMKEFGGEQDGKEEETIEEGIQDVDAEAQAQAKRDDAAGVDGGKGRFLASKAIGRAAGTGKIEGHLIRSEKRTTGSLSKDGAFFIERKENRVTTYHSFSLLQLYEGIKNMDYGSGHPAECSSHARFAPLQFNFDFSQFYFQLAKQ